MLQILLLLKGIKNKFSLKQENSPAKKIASIYRNIIKIIMAVFAMIIAIRTVAEMYDDKTVYFKPFAVPSSLISSGYTPEFFSARIFDQIDKIRREVRKKDKEISLKLETKEQTQKIELPGTGLTIKDITDFLREIFGVRAKQVSGNIIIGSGKMWLTVRVTGKPSAVFEADISAPLDAIDLAAVHIIKNIEPFTFGKYLAIKKEYDQMFELFEYVIDTCTDRAQCANAYLISGLRLFDLKKYEDALIEWKMASQRDPKSTDALVYQGWALDELGRFEEAIEKYRQVIEIDSENAGAYNNWGITLYKTGKLKEAITKFEKLTQIVPNYPQAYNNLGFILFDLKRYQEGIDNIKKAIELNPKESGFYDSLGQGYLKLKKYDQAIAQFDKALKLNPDNLEAKKNKNLALKLLKK